MSKKRITKAYWLWFQFSEKDMKKLNRIKFLVNKKISGPKFDIHLTLIGPYFKINKINYDLIKNITKKIKKFKINLKKYSYTKEKFTSLFIDVKKTYKLLSIREKFKKTNYFKSKDIYKPHISLFYGIVDKKTKIKIISKLPKLLKSCTVDKICIVDVNENTNKWKIIKKLKLN